MPICKLRDVKQIDFKHKVLKPPKADMSKTTTSSRINLSLFLQHSNTMAKLWILLTAFALLAIINVETYKNNYGKCKRVNSQEKFDMEKMLGKWYVIEATANNKKCLTYFLSKDYMRPLAYVLTETFAPPKIAQFFGVRNDYGRVGKLQVLGAYSPAVMSYKVPLEVLSYQFTVVSTDYDNYALIYSCKNMAFGLNRWSLIILSRTPRINRGVRSKIWSEVNSYGLDLYSMRWIDHASCEKKVTEVNPKTTTMEPVRTSEEVETTTTTFSSSSESFDETGSTTENDFAITSERIEYTVSN
ncbi:hypothetical protein FQR65_LT12573 [Abscondita terminalis]|nr:hypothetical protein FQR65_LT12573 [Abscondita terminalis]